MPQQHTNFHDDPGSLGGLETSLPSHLSSIAASANEMMPVEPDVEMSNDHDNISTTLFNHLNGLNGIISGQNAPQARTSMSWQNLAPEQTIDQDMLSTESTQNTNSQLVAHRNSNGPRAIAMNPSSRLTHFVSETGTSERAQRPKVRGRFSADRRKEVQQVRKQGACIRCRMLKKPCSGDTPCSTCKSVESARLWKQPCIRTRIAEEFTLFSAGLHSTLAFHDINNIKARVNFGQCSGRFEVFLLAENAPMVTFCGLKGNASPPSLGQILAFQNPGNEIPPVTEIFILDNEGDDISAKMEQYVREEAPNLFAREPSSFIQATLRFASNLSKEKDDTLLCKALELWSATDILTDLDLIWKISMNPDEAPLPANGPLLQTIAASTTLDGHQSINNTTNPYSYALLCSQLRAAVERRASNLSKSIMNEIERRLLQRQSGGRFETFLVAIIFLNCVERLCWLILTWHVDESRYSRWPLDKRPRPYADQGERFADILDMLLKMRSLAPKSSPQLDSGILMPVDDDDGLATQWFTKANISQSFLDQSGAAQFDPNNSRSLDGKYFARVLQPQAGYA
jgi:hypothetical protein